MQLHGQHFTRAEVLRRVGQIEQLGGVRRATLAEGRAAGVEALDFDCGSGLAFTVLPGRGLDITRATYRGMSLAWLAPGGASHAAYYEPEGLGWLRTFVAGLLTTCGLTYFGAPGEDEGEPLGLHGRYSTTPARQVCDLSAWEGDEYRVAVRGVVEEAVLFGDRVRLTRTISTCLGSRSILIDDVVENFGYRPSPLCLLYHVNLGFPLLDAASELYVAADHYEPYDDGSRQAADQRLRFSPPQPGFREQNYLYTLRPDGAGWNWAALVNRGLGGGLGLFLRFSAATLPYLNQWKMMGEADYVVGVEPANAPLANRGELRRQGQLPLLEPGESRTMQVELGVLEGQAEIDQFLTVHF